MLEPGKGPMHLQGAYHKLFLKRALEISQNGDLFIANLRNSNKQ